MIEDMKKYSEELAKSGGIVQNNLRDFLKPVRELMVNLKGETFSDNAILHGIWMLLAAHITFIACRSNKNAENEFVDKVSRSTQWEIGKAIEKLLKEHAGAGTLITFMEAPKEKEETNEQEG
jgi:hypothetical protein